MGRMAAKVVGYVEMIRIVILWISFIGFLVYAGGHILILVAVVHSKDTRDRYLAITFVVLAVIAIILTYQMIITRSLLKACNPEREISIAIQHCRRWRNVKIILLFFYPFSFYVAHLINIWFLIIPICSLIWHILATILVQNFINELTETQRTQQEISYDMISCPVLV